MKIIKALAVAGMMLFSLGASGQQAPEFSLKDLEGKTFSTAGLIGNKIIVINFWASWCPSCKDEIPELNAFKASAGADKAIFLGVNVGENEAKVKKFLKKNNYPYRILRDTDNRVAKLFDLDGLPATVIIDKDGTIVYKGSRPPKDFIFR